MEQEFEALFFGLMQLTFVFIPFLVVWLVVKQLTK